MDRIQTEPQRSSTNSIVDVPARTVPFHWVWAWFKTNCWSILIGVACAVLLLGVFLYLLLGGPKPPTNGNQLSTGDNNSLGPALKVLEKESDVDTCRSTLNKINSYYAQSQKQHPPTLGAEAAERLEKRFGLDRQAGDVAEIEGSSYTSLDAHYLDQCFLQRDAVRSLEADTRGAGRTPLERAVRAFDWVIRQVRLQDGLFATVPPQFALRRGWGTALDRALIFMALLQQLNDGGPQFSGCLLGWPAQVTESLKWPRQGAEPVELWACGIVIGDEPKMYLFDPRLGLPIPGPKGEGVATLAEVRKDPALLAQLTVKADHPYDVTQKRAQNVEIYQYCTLSALAPRMRFLQQELLAPAGIHVTLAVDAFAQEKRLKAAVAAEENPVPVQVLPHGATLLRTFLPQEEGGSNGMIDAAFVEINRFLDTQNQQRVLLPQQEVYKLELTPWFDLWLYFRNTTNFPYEVGLGQRVRALFAEPFVKFVLEPKQARDLMLRGDYPAAIQQLTGERGLSGDQLRELRKIENDPDLVNKVLAWVWRKRWRSVCRGKPSQRPKTRPREGCTCWQQQITKVWQTPEAELVLTLLFGAVAQKRSVETTYYLALCRHEQAEQAQLRLDLATQGGPAEKAEQEWGEALYWWRRFEDYQQAPEREAARRWHGKALAMLGDSAAAVEVWERDIPDSKHPLETVACLYLAARARKK